MCISTTRPKSPSATKSSSHHDELFSLGTHGDELNPHAHELREAAQVEPGGLRQVVPGADLAGGLLPPRPGLVDRLALGVDRRVRHVGEHLVLPPVAGTDLDLFEAVEHVELGDREPGEAVQPRGVAEGHRVEPAAAAAAAGGGAVLTADRHQPLAELVVQLHRKRAGAHRGSIRLDHAEHVLDRLRRQARACRGRARDRV